MSLPSVTLAPHQTPIDSLARLSAHLGPASPRLFIKRDDLLSFGMGGNKIRKLQTTLADAAAAGADTLITCGGVQSNHARATAAAGAALGFHVVLVVNGAPSATPTGNARLDRLFGAEIRYVATRDQRVPMMEQAAADLGRAGRRPFVIPLGASTAIGALGFAKGVGEIAAAGLKPNVIVHSTSSGGTQAGLIAGCALFGVKAHIVGVSADDPADALRAVVSRLLDDMAARLGATPASVGADKPIEIDDTFVGEGYGRPTAESTEALELLARREGTVLDPVYTAKAMAGLIARIRTSAYTKDDTILFWHTGGQPGLFA
jgi:D-cysteine desulfhydrase family pyridoxal phosphate-dependent enzyme